MSQQWTLAIPFIMAHIWSVQSASFMPKFNRIGSRRLRRLTACISCSRINIKPDNSDNFTRHHRRFIHFWMSWPWFDSSKRSKMTLTISRTLIQGILPSGDGVSVVSPRSQPLWRMRRVNSSIVALALHRSLTGATRVSHLEGGSISSSYHDLIINTSHQINF